MKTQLHILGCLLAAGEMALADSWTLRAEVKDTPYQFGDVRIVLRYDSTQNKTYPKYRLRIFHGDRLMAEHDDVGFERIFANDTQSYFLGVSNRGLIPQAYVIFDRNGHVLKAQRHDPREVRYHEMSVTLIRKWCHPEDPAPEFALEERHLKNVTVRAWDGSRVWLMGEVTKPANPGGATNSQSARVR